MNLSSIDPPFQADGFSLMDASWQQLRWKGKRVIPTEVAR
jgi:hypothetical protein